MLEKMKPGKIDTFIRVKTNDKEVPELKILVVGKCFKDSFPFQGSVFSRWSGPPCPPEP